MGWQRAKYKEVRKKMQPGDIIAFGGKTHFSELIKWATGSGVTHVGVILQSKLMIYDEIQEGFFNQVIESANINGFSGVSISRMSDRMEAYSGETWWLPLNKEIRSQLDFKNFYSFLLRQERKKYDLPQAIKSAMDSTDNYRFYARQPLPRKISRNFFVPN